MFGSGSGPDDTFDAGNDAEKGIRVQSFGIIFDPPPTDIFPADGSELFERCQSHRLKLWQRYGAKVFNAFERSTGVFHSVQVID